MADWKAKGNYRLAEACAVALEAYPVEIANLGKDLSSEFKQI